jgi:hypothetical protein
MSVRLRPSPSLASVVSTASTRPLYGRGAGSTPAGGSFLGGRSSDGRAPGRHSGEARSIRVVRSTGLWCNGSMTSSNLVGPGSRPGGPAHNARSSRAGVARLSGESGCTSCAAAVRIRVPTASHDRDVLPCCGPERFRLSTPHRQVAGSSPARSPSCSGSSAGRAVPGCTSTTAAVPHHHHHRSPHQLTRQKGGASCRI